MENFISHKIMIISSQVNSKGYEWENMQLVEKSG